MQVLQTLMKHDTLGPVHQAGALRLVEKPFYPIADLVTYMRSSKYPLINSDPQKRHTWEGLLCDGFIFADMRANATFDNGTLLKYKAVITYDVRAARSINGVWKVRSLSIAIALRSRPGMRRTRQCLCGKFARLWVSTGHDLHVQAFVSHG
jgi:hypothetical protein